MDRKNVLDAFQFHNDQLFNQEIYAKSCLNQLSAVSNWKLNLPDQAYFPIEQLFHEASFIC